MTVLFLPITTIIEAGEKEKFEIVTSGPGTLDELVRLDVVLVAVLVAVTVPLVELVVTTALVVCV